MDDPLKLPFDQYQRYCLAAETLAALEGPGSSAPLVEVGGYPPRLHQFLPGRDITIVDVEPGDAKRYVIAKGSVLPFADRSFGAAVSLDTLEHVPPGDRGKFVSELCRVASDHVILAAPFDAEAVRAADRAVLDLVRSQTGSEHRFLAEHVELGLPDMAEAKAAMEEADFEVRVLPSGRLDRWLFMMALYYALDSDPDLKGSLPALMEAYNLACYQCDRAEPAYRHLLAGSRKPIEAKLDAVVHSPSTEDAVLSLPDAISPVLEYARVLALREKDREIEGLKGVLAARDDQIKAQGDHIRALEDFAARVKSLPLYSLYQKFIKRK